MMQVLEPRAAERLDGQRSRTGEQVEHGVRPGVLAGRREHREEGLLDAVADGAGARSWRLEAQSAGLAR